MKNLARVFFVILTFCGFINVFAKSSKVNVYVLSNSHVIVNDRDELDKNYDSMTDDFVVINPSNDDMDSEEESEFDVLPAENDNSSDNKSVDRAAIDFDMQELINVAKEARENAYCPYSKFKVGAAVLAKSGKIYTGCNVENASYGLCNCAERTAIFKAVSEGEKGNFIVAIAIVLDAPEFGAPCGACRQVINEFADSDAVIIMGTVNGNYKVEALSTLLPYAFKLEEDKE